MASLFFIFRTKVHNNFAQATNKHKKEERKHRKNIHFNDTIMPPGKKNKQTKQQKPYPMSIGFHCVLYDK